MSYFDRSLTSYRYAGTVWLVLNSLSSAEDVIEITSNNILLQSNVNATSPFSPGTEFFPLSMLALALAIVGTLLLVLPALCCVKQKATIAEGDVDKSGQSSHALL